MRLMATKLPVLNEYIPLGNNQRRWRTPALALHGETDWPPGGFRVGCRGCQRDYQQLISSYLSNPAIGPTLHLAADHPDYEDYEDPEWVYTKGLRLMTFLCLACDKHVNWESVMRNRFHL